MEQSWSRLMERVEGNRSAAFGLDLAGYSTCGSALAKAVRRGPLVEVVVFLGHCFSRNRSGSETLERVAQEEIEILRACLELGEIDVDVPIHLQGLPAPKSPTYVWELIQRPV